MCAVALTTLMAFAMPAAAAINLEFRPPVQMVTLGNPANIGIYAVSDSETSQFMSAADVIFNWNASLVGLTGNSNAGAAPLLVSGFPINSPFNATYADGNAHYAAFANFGSPLAATPEGTLLTTLNFSTLGLTAGTAVDIVPPGSGSIFTAVYDGFVPGLAVTGTLSGATVQIVPEPATALLAACGLFAVLRRRRLRG